MEEEYTFFPDQRSGNFFQISAVILLAIASGLGIWQAVQSDIGPVFLLYLLPSLFSAVAIPLLAYRYYGLRSAAYTLRRDSIRLRWGLRIEEIPIQLITWVHTLPELKTHLVLPRLRWPGSVLGSRHEPGLGEVEFLAASTRNLILIATAERIFAISPANPQAFLTTFQRFAEMGSLTPSAAVSVYPTLLLRQVWMSSSARILIACGLSFSLILLTWVSLVIPTQTSLFISFRSDGSPGDLVPAVRLLLLPVINSIFYLADLFLGLFFFRRKESQYLAYLLWICGALTPLLFLGAVFALLRAG